MASRKKIRDEALKDPGSPTFTAAATRASELQKEKLAARKAKSEDDAAGMRKRLLAQTIKEKKITDKDLAGAEAIGTAAAQSGESVDKVNPKLAKLKGTGKHVEDSDEDLDKQHKIATVIAGLAPVLAGFALGGMEGGALGGEIGAKTAAGLGEDAAARQKRKKEMKFQKEESETSREFKAQQAQLDREFKLQLQRMKDAAVRSGNRQIKDHEFRAANFVQKMESAEKVLAELKANGFDPTASGRRFIEWRLVPRESLSEDEQRYQQALRAFVNSALRDESGASIKNEEFQSKAEELFPRPGEKGGTVEQKRIARLDAIAGLAAEGGPAIALVRQQRARLGESPQQAPGSQASKSISLVGAKTIADDWRVNDPAKFEQLRDLIRNKGMSLQDAVVSVRRGG